MSGIKRFQIDLTEDELRSIDRLGALAGLRTKKEVVLNAITLLRWAAREIMYGRMVGSINRETGAVKEVELPALSIISEKAIENLSDTEIRNRIAEGVRAIHEAQELLTTKGVLLNAISTEVGKESRGGLEESV